MSEGEIKRKKRGKGKRERQRVKRGIEIERIRERYNHHLADYEVGKRPRKVLVMLFVVCEHLIAWPTASFTSDTSRDTKCRGANRYKVSRVRYVHNIFVCKYCFYEKSSVMQKKQLISAHFLNFPMSLLLPFVFSKLRLPERIGNQISNFQLLKKLLELMGVKSNKLF